MSPPGLVHRQTDPRPAPRTPHTTHVPYGEKRRLDLAAATPAPAFRSRVFSLQLPHWKAFGVSPVGAVCDPAPSVGLEVPLHSDPGVSLYKSEEVPTAPALC